MSEDKCKTCGGDIVEYHQYASDGPVFKGLICVSCRHTSQEEKKMEDSVRTPQLGDWVEDRITGYRGFVIGITEWLYGCRRLGLQAVEIHEGKPVEPYWLDSAQCKVLAIPQKDIGKADPVAPAGPRNDKAVIKKDPTR